MGRDGGWDPRVGWQVGIGQVIMEQGKERIGRYFMFLGLMTDAVFPVDE